MLTVCPMSIFVKINFTCFVRLVVGFRIKFPVEILWDGLGGMVIDCMLWCPQGWVTGMWIYLFDHNARAMQNRHLLATFYAVLPFVYGTSECKQGLVALLRSRTQILLLISALPFIFRVFNFSALGLTSKVANMCGSSYEKRPRPARIDS